MSRYRAPFLAVLCLLVLPCLSAVAAVLIFQASQGGGLARWRRLPAPPVALTDLVAADLNTVYARGADEALYGCVHRRGVDGPACWSPVADAPRPDSAAAFDQPELTSPAPPRVALDTLTVTYDYADALFEAHYALLDDGRVWVWAYGTGGYLALAQLCLAPLAGAAAGGLLGAFLLAAALIQLRPRAAPKNPQNLPSSTQLP